MFKTQVRTSSKGTPERRMELIGELDQVIGTFAGLKSDADVEDCVLEWQRKFQGSGIIMNNGLELAAAVARKMNRETKNGNGYRRFGNNNNNKPCSYCKQYGHYRDKCPKQYSDETVDHSQICLSYNSERGCKMQSWKCPKLHICSKCQKYHRQHPSTLCRA